MRLAVIPARGGSKRIPRKNVRHFAGRPMIAYAIEAARACGQFDQIILSTDDEEIGALARALGAETPFLRPSELADDFTPTVSVIAHAVRAMVDLGRPAEVVCCIYPAVPLIAIEDLRRAHAMLGTGIAAYVFPVVAFPSPIQRALRKLEDGRVEPFYVGNEEIRTQDLEPAYHDAGQFYWGQAAAWLQELEIHTNGAGFVVPSWRAVDIDTPEDWQRAELLFEVLRRR